MPNVYLNVDVKNIKPPHVKPPQVERNVMTADFLAGLTFAAVNIPQGFLAEPQLGRSVNWAIGAGRAFLEQVDRDMQETAAHS